MSTACRCSPPTRSTSSTSLRHDRRQKDQSAPMPATWSRSKWTMENGIRLKPATCFGASEVGWCSAISYIGYVALRHGGEPAFCSSKPIGTTPDARALLSVIRRGGGSTHAGWCAVHRADLLPLHHGAGPPGEFVPKILSPTKFAALFAPRRERADPRNHQMGLSRNST